MKRKRTFVSGKKQPLAIDVANKPSEQAINAWVSRTLHHVKWMEDVHRWDT